MAGDTLKSLPPQDAIDYFRNKGLETSFGWQDVWKEEHARAFTVAKAMDREVLQDIRDALDKALADGMTLEQFLEELTPKLQERGWWGRRKMVDPQSGEEKTVQLGSPKRLRVIFETNMRTAYAAGRWKRFQRTKDAFPYLKYNHTPQEHPRPEHVAWDGTILPIDDPWWDTHFTPNGWNCKCYITQTSKRLMDARGEVVSDKPVKFPPKPYKNPRTGEITVVETGIDPGWDYNVGKEPLDGLTPKPTPETPAESSSETTGGPSQGRSGRAAPGAAPEASPEEPGAGPSPQAEEESPIVARPGPAPLSEAVTREEAEAGFLGAFDLAPGEATVVNDSAGEPLVIGDGLFKSSAERPVTFSQSQLRALTLVAATLKDPDEIRVVWRPAANEKNLLVRRYIARWTNPAGGPPIDVAVDMAPGGAAPTWSFSTSLDGPLDLAALRRGLVAWTRRAD